jgi:hypothetical protein
MLTNATNEQYDLVQLMKIETSLTNGINFLLETTDTQLVAVDTHKTVKFYDFVDKHLKEEEERKQKDDERLTALIKEVFE